MIQPGRPLEQGEPCPVCGQHVNTPDVVSELLGALVEAVAELENVAEWDEQPDQAVIQRARIAIANVERRGER